MKEKIKKYWWIIIIVSLLFYWFQIRPSQIYSGCHEIAIDKAKKLLETKSEMSGGYKYEEAVEKELFLKDDYDSNYEKCLRSKGINK